MTARVIRGCARDARRTASYSCSANRLITRLTTAAKRRRQRHLDQRESDLVGDGHQIGRDLGGTRARFRIPPPPHLPRRAFGDSGRAFAEWDGNRMPVVRMNSPPVNHRKGSSNSVACANVISRPTPWAPPLSSSARSGCANIHRTAIVMGWTVQLGASAIKDFTFLAAAFTCESAHTCSHTPHKVRVPC